MTYKQQIIDLWQACFGDSDEFVQLYFSTKYTEENSVLYVENERVLSALQMLPYSMSCWGRELHTSYISGASTWPEVRGRGLMRALLTKAFDIMRSRNIHLSTLIPAEPWLFDFYKKAGYGTVFYSAVRTFTDIFPETVFQHSYSEEELYAYFMISMRNRPCCIQHTFADFQVILADLHLAGGGVVTVSGDNRFIKGLAMIVPNSGKVWIKEWMYDDEKTRISLLSGIKALYPKYEIAAIVPARKENGSEFGMIRVIDAPMILQYYAAAHPETDWSFSLKDDQIPSNTADYLLRKGYCEKFSFRTEERNDIFSPVELVEKLYSGKSDPVPCMSLMLN